MSVRMKKPLTKAKVVTGNDDVLLVTSGRDKYLVPKKVLNIYRCKEGLDGSVDANKLFAALDQRYTRAGVLLQGVRYREEMTQAEFAKKINVTQANLSKMENGKRPIGKVIAKRIQAAFGFDYRMFLE